MAEENTEENGAEENVDQVPRRQPAHPRVAKEVQVEKIIDDIEAPGPLTRSKASHLSNFCGHYDFVSISEPTKVDEAFLEHEWIRPCKKNYNSSNSTMSGNWSSSQAQYHWHKVDLPQQAR